MMQEVIRKIESHNRKALVWYSTRQKSILVFINREMYAGCHNTLSANGLSFTICRKVSFLTRQGRIEI